MTLFEVGTHVRTNDPNVMPIAGEVIGHSVVKSPMGAIHVLTLVRLDVGFYTDVPSAPGRCFISVLPVSSDILEKTA